VIVSGVAWSPPLLGRNISWADLAALEPGTMADPTAKRGWNPGRGSLELERQVLPFIQVLPTIWSALLLRLRRPGWPSPPRAYCRFRGVVHATATPPMAGATGGGPWSLHRRGCHRTGRRAAAD